VSLRKQLIDFCCHKIPHVWGIYLFGSALTNEATAKDVDVAVGAGLGAL